MTVYFSSWVSLPTYDKKSLNDVELILVSKDPADVKFNQIACVKHSNRSVMIYDMVVVLPSSKAKFLPK